MHTTTLFVSSLAFLAANAIPLPQSYGHGSSSNFDTASAPAIAPSVESVSPVGGLSGGGYGSPSTFGGASPLGGAKSLATGGKKGGVTVGDNVCAGKNSDEKFSAAGNFDCNGNSDSLFDGNTGNLSGDADGDFSGDGSGNIFGNKNGLFSGNKVHKRQGGATVGDNVGLSSTDKVLGSVVDNGSGNWNGDSAVDGNSDNGSADFDGDGSGDFSKNVAFNGNLLGSDNSFKSFKA